MTSGSFETRESIYAIAREWSGSNPVGPACGEAPAQGVIMLANGAHHGPTEARNFLASSSASRLAVCGHAAAQQLPSAALLAGAPIPASEEAVAGPIPCAVSISAAAGAAAVASVEAAPASLPTGEMAVVSAGASL